MFKRLQSILYIILLLFHLCLEIEIGAKLKLLFTEYILYFLI